MNFIRLSKLVFTGLIITASVYLTGRLTSRLHNCVGQMLGCVLQERGAMRALLIFKVGLEGLKEEAETFTTWW